MSLTQKLGGEVRMIGLEADFGLSEAVLNAQNETCSLKKQGILRNILRHISTDTITLVCTRNRWPKKLRLLLTMQFAMTIFRGSVQTALKDTEQNKKPHSPAEREYHDVVGTMQTDSVGESPRTISL